MGEINRKYDLVTLGEVMLRLSPPRYTRISDGEIFEKHAGGAELNVASGVAQLGLSTALVSKLPDNELGTYIKKRIGFEFVDTGLLLYDGNEDSRLGVYYYESGASPRKPLTIYDRRSSTINTLKADELPESFWACTRMFHTSGITLALSPELRSETISIIKRLKDAGTVISFDVNYRASLWSEEEAKGTIEQLISLTDVLFVSEETGRRMFKRTGDLRDIMRGFANDYGIDVVASTKRKVHSPSRHDFGSLVYDRRTDTFYSEEPYRDIEVVDRIGSGDAYVAGALYGLLKYDDADKAMRYGDAMGALKNTIPGDQVSSSISEIEDIIERHRTGDTGSELRR